MHMNISAAQKQLRSRAPKDKDSYELVLSTAGAFHRLTISSGAKKFYVAGVKNEKLASGTIELKVTEAEKTNLFKCPC